MTRPFVIALLLIAIDFSVFMYLGLMLMDYDDFYDPSKGEYWSLASMNTTQKAVYISFQVWQILNILTAIYLAYIWVKKRKLQS